MVIKNILLFFILITSLAAGESDLYNLAVETYKRGDLFNTITYANEVIFDKANDEHIKCKGILLKMESFAESGNVDYVFDKKKRIYEFCGTDKGNLFLSSLASYYSSQNFGYEFLLDNIKRGSKYQQIFIEFMIVYLLKNGKFDLAKNYAKMKKEWYLISPVSLNGFYSELKKFYRKKRREEKFITSISAVPGLGEYWLDKKVAGIGAVSIVSVLSLSGVFSAYTGGFFEPWFFVAFTYYLGSISNTLRIEERVQKERYKKIIKKYLFNDDKIGRKRIFLIILKNI